MKRVLICLLALLLAAPFAIAGADTNPMTALKLETEQSGDLLDVRFVADMAYPTETAAFESMDFVLTYASDVLEFVELVKSGEQPESGVLDGSFIGVENAQTAGKFEYHCASALGSRGSGLLLHLRFRVIRDGAYGFHIKRDGYSIYDSAEHASKSYRFALLSIDVAGTDDVKLPQIPDPREPVVTQPEPEKGWFSKLIDSIFGSSCTGGR